MHLKRPSFAAILISTFFVAETVQAQQTRSLPGDNGMYAFATYGLASHNANLDSTVSSGSLSLTRTTDDDGTALVLGIGLRQSESIAFEFFGGNVTGFGSTTTITATNAIIDGNTLNGSLSLKEDVSSELIGASVVFSNQLRFIDDQTDSGAKLSFSGKFGLLSYNIKDELTLYGSGTVNGTSYAISSPVILKIKESGTAPNFGATLNYAANDVLELKLGLDYIPNVGGGDLVEADITMYTVSLKMTF